MTIGLARYRPLLAVLAVFSLACGGSDVQSPTGNSIASSVDGTVVYEDTGGTVPDVGVVLQQCEPGMMMQDAWRQLQRTTTDSQGRFHFEYMHEGMHRYRVGVDGMWGPRGQCYVGSGDQTSVTLRVAP